MAQRQPVQQVSEPIDTGGRLDTQQRRVQNHGAGSSVSVNLTDLGRRVHDISDGDNLSVNVCEHGIWITTNE